MMEEQILPQEAQPGAHGELEEFVDGPDEGDAWRLVDDDYYRVAESEPDEDPEDVDPVKSALLWQYSIAKLSRQTVGVTPEQFAAIRRRTAARRAEMARAERMKARNDAARNARPETTTSARPRTPKARRPSTRVNAATTSPQPSPPEPEPHLGPLEQATDLLHKTSPAAEQDRSQAAGATRTRQRRHNESTTLRKTGGDWDATPVVRGSFAVSLHPSTPGGGDQEVVARIKPIDQPTRELTTRGFRLSDDVLDVISELLVELVHEDDDCS
ncbi:hypothetical protein [Polyangium mundeleinium]|uniref:Uncharacterized protein n=1 Tax=Polyangium mundeleinium TaxID=2995306 RepID=A0ABT5EN46_9BACT|nr:hypothetical protein [Polyangium mundeleinium]MDC0743166.1 hypothetical protein [Polyangium mundeleinium]